MTAKWSSIKRGTKEHKEARFTPPSPPASKKGTGFPSHQPFKKP